MKKVNLFHNFDKNNTNDDEKLIDLYTKEEESLQNSLKMINNYTEMGIHTLESLNNQRSTLKMAQTKLLDVLNTMGISNTLINVIRRKEGSNATLTYSCMILTIVIICAALYYFRM